MRRVFFSALTSRRRSARRLRRGRRPGRSRTRRCRAGPRESCPRPRRGPPPPGPRETGHGHGAEPGPAVTGGAGARLVELEEGAGPRCPRSWLLPEYREERTPGAPRAHRPRARCHRRWRGARWPRPVPAPSGVRCPRGCHRTPRRRRPRSGGPRARPITHRCRPRARRSRPPCRDWRWRAPCAAARWHPTPFPLTVAGVVTRSGGFVDHGALGVEEHGDAALGQTHELVELTARERHSFGGPCTSTNRPDPVMTTFMSTSARESSE